MTKIWIVAVVQIPEATKSKSSNSVVSAVTKTLKDHPDAKRWGVTCSTEFESAIRAVCEEQET